MLPILIGEAVARLELRVAREAEQALGDHVPLDLAGAAGDRE
jgi:hypothetical protein